MADVIALPTAASAPPLNPTRKKHASHLKHERTPGVVPTPLLQDKRLERHREQQEQADVQAQTAAHLEVLRRPPIQTDFSGLSTEQKFRMLVHRHAEMLMLITELRIELRFN